MRPNRNTNSEYTNHITIIIELIQNNNEAELRTFLESHPYLNLATIDEEQRTVFHWAAEQPNTKLFEILLQFLKIRCPLDFLILQKDVYGNTPLMIAITHGHGDIIKRIDAIQKEPLINWKEEVNQIRIPNFMTSLDMAFNKGHLEKSTAALKACTKLEDIIPTIVLWAIQNTQLEVIKTCWESLADPETQIDMIMAAIAAKQHEAIVFLHTQYPNHFIPFLRCYTPARAGNIETFLYIQQIANEQDITISFKPKDLVKAATSGCLAVFQAVESTLNEMDLTEFYQQSLTAASGAPGSGTKNILSYLLEKELILDKTKAIKESIRSKNLIHYHLLYENDDTQQSNANLLQDALPAFLEQDPQFAQTLLAQGVVASVDYYTEYTATNKPLHKLGEHKKWRYKLSISWRLTKICLLSLAIIKNCPLTMIEMIIAQQPLLRLRTGLLYAIFRGDQVIIDRIILAIQNKQKSNHEANEKINLTDLIITAIKTLAKPDKTVLSLLHMVIDSDIHNCSALNYALLYGLSDTVVNALYQKGMWLHHFTSEAMRPAIARDETLALALFNDCQEHGTALDNTNLARYCLEQNKFNFLLQLIDANSHTKHEETPSTDNRGYKGLFFRWDQKKPEAKPISLQFASINCAIELSCKEYLKNRHAWSGVALTDDMCKTIADKLAHAPPSEITTICLANGLSLITLTNAALKAENLKLLYYCLQNGINQHSSFSIITFEFHFGRAHEIYGVYDQEICLLHMLTKHPNQTFAKSAIQMLYKEFHWSLDWDANTEFFSPLHIAAWEGKDEIVSYLLALGDDINKQNKIGLTPLHAAAFQSHEHVVSTLITSGANVRQLTNEGRSSLYCAFLSRKMTSTPIERLVEAGGFIEGENYLQAHMVARYNSDRLVGKIPKNANLLSTRALNLCVAVNKAFDTIDCTKALHGLPNTFFYEGNNSKQPKYPLHAAIYREDIALLEQLIEAGADLNQPDENNKLPIDIAIQSCRGLWIIPILFENGLEQDEELMKKLKPL